LVRAAQLITEIAGGEIEGDIIDVYPSPIEKKQVNLKYAYLKKLSGKEYEPVTAKNILSALEFDLLMEEENSITVAAPLSKADISLPADIVEEIIRIDGLNNIAIPSSITISPSVEESTLRENLKEKMSGMLAGLGFNEIVTNSITNSKNYNENELSSSVRLLNNLSAELDILRPSMLETGLEILAYNINRKNNNLRFFELGKIYKHGSAAYSELEKVCFWITGKKQNANWKHQEAETDFFTAKGIIVSLLDNINIADILFEEPQSSPAGNIQSFSKNKNELGNVLQVSNAMLQKFGIKQPVIYAELDVDNLLNASVKEEIIYKEIPQFPVVERDLSMMISKDIAYGNIATALKQVQVKFLQDFNLFDIYESDKIAKDKKSYAINFRFMNNERTLTDAEVEAGMKAIMNKLVKDFNAEIRH
jgi:phenylalanyl-tRNA synthetase beta chain